jgi:hypothetical protein
MSRDLGVVLEALMAADVDGLFVAEVLSAELAFAAAQAPANAFPPAFRGKRLGCAWWPLTPNSLMLLGRSTVAVMMPVASALAVSSLISASLRSCRRQASCYVRVMRQAVGRVLKRFMNRRETYSQ